MRNSALPTSLKPRYWGVTLPVITKKLKEVPPSPVWVERNTQLKNDSILMVLAVLETKIDQTKNYLHWLVSQEELLILSDQIGVGHIRYMVGNIQHVYLVGKSISRINGFIAILYCIIDFINKPF